MKTKVQEKMKELQAKLAEASEEAKEEVQEQIEKLKHLSQNMGEKLEDFRAELGEEWKELKEKANEKWGDDGEEIKEQKAAEKLGELRDRFKDWFGDKDEDQPAGEAGRKRSTARCLIVQDSGPFKSANSLILNNPSRVRLGLISSNTSLKGCKIEDTPVATAR